MARILFQNTVLVATVATVELPQFTVSLFPRLAAYCLHRRSFPAREVASAISTIANYCNRQYCKVLVLANLHIISIVILYVHSKNQMQYQYEKYCTVLWPLLLAEAL